MAAARLMARVCFTANAGDVDETGMDLGATRAGSITSVWRATIGRDPSMHRNGIPALQVCLPALRPKHDDVDLKLLILLFHSQVP